MRINGYNGSVYVVELVGELSGIYESISKSDSGLIYSGADMDVYFYVNGRSFVVTLANGFEWDGASIPGIFQWLIGHPSDQLFRVPSLLHDSGYGDRTKRVFHDVIFYYLLRRAGLPGWKSWLMYVAVRVGGHVFYAAESSRFWRGVRWLLDRI